MTASCTPDGQRTPFLCFIEIVRGAFRISAGDAEETVRLNLQDGLMRLGLASSENLGLLLNLLGLKAPEQVLAELDGVLIGLRTRDLLQRLVQARCALTPVIMFFEDLHWVDSASEELLGNIIATEERLRLLVLHTRRPEYRPPWVEGERVTTLRLEPLSAQETSRIIQARLGADELPGTLAKLMVAKAEGNALFAEEISSFLVERGIVRHDSAGLLFDEAAVVAALPGSVQSLLTARVDRLAPNDRALLQAAAVIGRRFSPELLADISGAGGNVDARLTAIQALDLVHLDPNSGDYSFKHALVRDALYQSLLSGPRATLHRDVAVEIERRAGNRLIEVAEVLAHHYAQTERIQKAFHYLAMAGEKSAGVYSLDEAERYFEQALRLYEAHADLANETAFIGLLASMSQLLFNKSKWRELRRLVDRNLPCIDTLSDSPQVVIILWNYTSAAVRKCEFGLALAAADRAMAMAERLNDKRSKAYARTMVIYAKSSAGQLSLEEAQHQKSLLVQESQGVNDPNLQIVALINSAWDHTQRGHTDLARAQLIELEARGRRTGDPRASGASLGFFGVIDIIDQRWDDAVRRGDECIRTALTPFDRELGVIVKGIAQLFRGQVREGAKVLSGLRERAIARDDMFTLDCVDPPLGVAKVLLGDFAGGIRAMAELLKRAANRNHRFGADLARLYQAETYIELLSPKEMPPLGVLIKNLWFLAIIAVTGRKTAMELLTEARKNPMYTGASINLAQIDTDLGMLLKLRKEYGAAREHLDRARPIAVQLKAAGLLAKIDTALAALRLR